MITDYQKSEAFFAGEMYSTICVEWAADYFGLSLTSIDPLSKMGEKSLLHDFRSLDL